MIVEIDPQKIYIFVTGIIGFIFLKRGYGIGRIGKEQIVNPVLLQ